MDFFILKSQDVKCRRYKGFRSFPKSAINDKIGNRNGLLCRLHSKPHTVRAQNTLRCQWHFIYSFPKTDPAISKHLKNIFEEGELDKEVVVSKMEITTQHGALEEKTQTHKVDFFISQITIPTQAN